MTSETVLCPKCKSPMRLRNSVRGQFYGCSTYPKCNGTRNAAGGTNGNGKQAGAGEKTYEPMIMVKGSPEQEDIWTAMCTGHYHMVVDAVAGSGKTFSMLQGCLRMPKSANILFVAFNKHIAAEAQGKIRASGFTNVTASTYHSLGYRMLREYYPKTKINEDKVNNILEQVPEVPALHFQWGSVMGMCRKLVSLAKNYLLDFEAPDFNAEMERVADHHGMDLNGIGATAISMVPGVLRECIRRTSIDIDFDDMIWLPVWKDLPCPEKFDMMITDESQDLNACQQALAFKACFAGRIVIVGDVHQCQPKGTLVYKTGTGYVPIETIQTGDEMLTYYSGSFPGAGTHKAGRAGQGRKVLETASRAYDGVLINIEAGEFQHSVTPEHRCVVKMEKRNGWAVYALQKGHHARVGMTRSAVNPAQSVALRARQEKADKAWILGIFEDRDSAAQLEANIAYRYGLPQIIFTHNSAKGSRTEKWLKGFWGTFPSNVAPLVRCLHEFNRLHTCPFWELSKNGGEAGSKKGSLYTFYTAACNLLEGWMRVCTYDNTPRSKPNWKGIVLSRRQYKGKVYSLRLQDRWRGGPTYIAQGIVTHNSIYGFRGAGITSIPDMTKKLSETDRGVRCLPLTVTRRCPKSHVALAQAIVPQIQALDNAPEGEILTMERGKAIAIMVPGDLAICRVNAQLIPTAYDLIARGVKPVIKGRDLGAGLIAMVEKLEKRATSLPALNIALSEYRAKKESKLMALGEKAEGRVSALRDKCDCLTEFISHSSTIPELKSKIASMFSDFDADGAPKQAVILGTIHRTKGLEAHRVFILSPELLPHPMAKREWEQAQELNLVYVSVTRAAFDAKAGKPGTLIFCGPIPPILQSRKEQIIATPQEEECPKQSV